MGKLETFCKKETLMNLWTKTRSILVLTGIALAFALPFLGGCEKESTGKRETKQTPVSQAKSKFINTRCPIMGTPINPDKVPENLTRVFKGQKVAFCCGGCPDEWDKLTDKEKEAKLKEAASKK
jgi:hypothetical protein